MEAADLGLRVEHLDGTDGRRLNTEAATTGFCETREVVFTAPAEFEGDLFLDDERLLRDGSENRWKWRPGFYAGEVRAEFVDPTGQSLGVFRLDVSPDPKKLGADTFARMLGEIAAFDPRLLEGSEPARHPSGPSAKSRIRSWLSFVSGGARRPSAERSPTSAPNRSAGCGRAAISSRSPGCAASTTALWSAP